MKMGTKGHYAVSALLELAKQSSNNKPVSINFLAEKQGISAPYLESLFFKLRQRQLVTSVRGAQGGYILVRPADQISLWEVITAVGEGMRVNRCKKQNTGDSCFKRSTLCDLHGVWDDLSKKICSYLSNISLQNMIDTAHSNPSFPLNLDNHNTTYKHKDPTGF
ncbi:MAG: Rrf2 family transcriptional regulator [Alphaproteobacteria bacterium]